jgi:hypothetical protein
MKFRFPVVIIDEDWKSESASGLGIRALAKALEDQGTEVVGGFTYIDVTMVANQAARASAFVVSIDDEEITEEGPESRRHPGSEASSSSKRASATPTSRSSCSARHAPRSTSRTRS